MTRLSVNINKLALLRNSRGHDTPNLLAFVADFIALGVTSITIHPRPDERHIKRQDAYDLAQFIGSQAGIELNIEGYPSAAFLELIEAVKPDQTTLVPDLPGQLTSDHGFDLSTQGQLIADIAQRLEPTQSRISVFLDPDVEQVRLAARLGIQRIELYTEAYANAFQSAASDTVYQQYRAAATEATELGLGVNAGHDLNLENLPKFLSIPGIAEVSIGHALTIECLQWGMAHVIRRYLHICQNAAH